MSLTDVELRQRIEFIGVDELGRRYAARTVERLNAMYAAGDAWRVESASDEDGWIDFVGFDGEQLTNGGVRCHAPRP